MDSLVPVLIPILIVVVLLLLNALFVAAEFAIVGVPRSAIEHRVAQGNRLARLVSRTLSTPRNQDRYIATAQLGITLSSLGLGMYGEHELATWLAGWFDALGASRWIAAHALASVVAIIVLTYFHIVIGEMVPKSLALQYAERTALWVTRPMLLIKAALYPLVIGLNNVGNGILKLFGVDRQTVGTQHYHSAEELQLIVEESQRGGMLRTETGQVVRDLFEFGELTAGEVMIPRVRITGIPLAVGHSDLAAVLHTSQHTRYPVYDGDIDHILGVIHIKHLLRRLIDGGPPKLEDTRPVPCVPATSSVDTVLTAMRRERTQMVIVMDEHGGTAGIITIEDLFEEVIGGIDEEAATGHPEIHRDALGYLHAAGTVRLEEVGESLGLALEHEEVDTVSGLILMLLERPATVGDIVHYVGVQFEVTAVEGNGVQKCRITSEQVPDKES